MFLFWFVHPVLDMLTAPGSVEAWLKQFHLSELTEKLIDNGYDNLHFMVCVYLFVCLFIAKRFSVPSFYIIFIMLTSSYNIHNANLRFP